MVVRVRHNKMLQLGQHSCSRPVIVTMAMTVLVVVVVSWGRRVIVTVLVVVVR